MVRSVVMPRPGSLITLEAARMGQTKVDLRDMPSTLGQASLGPRAKVVTRVDVGEPALYVGHAYVDLHPGEGRERKGPYGYRHPGLTFYLVICGSYVAWVSLETCDVKVHW